ncbi:hypothetical protein HK101_004056 [Irineochytrium annulatum]|nr:hypothetical protein HK101_004056 [Irineochytrium annulatum]
MEPYGIAYAVVKLTIDGVDAVGTEGWYGVVEPGPFKVAIVMRDGSALSLDGVEVGVDVAPAKKGRTVAKSASSRRLEDNKKNWDKLWARYGVVTSGNV